MSIAKVIEVLAEGENLEAAVAGAVREASKTVHGIKHAYIQDIQALVDNNQITRYRVNVKLTFVVEKT